MPSRAAAAVRTLPRTARLIPMNPVRPEKLAPTRNARVRKMPEGTKPSTVWWVCVSTTLVEVTNTKTATGTTITAIAATRQISGITPLFSFLPEIFRSAGTATSNAFFQSVLVSLVNLLFTLFALWLVDRAGRKTLILAGTAVQFISFALVGWFYHVHGSGLAVLILVMSFVAGHAFGNGVACWVIISEIYPTKVRGRGMSIATTALWLVGYLGNQLFPIMQKRLGSDGTFWCFSAGALLTIILVGWLIPETKGRSLEEITKLWTEEKPVMVG